MKTKVLWSWSEWSETEMAEVMLPLLFLSQLAGKTTLYLFGEFTLYDPTRLSETALSILRIVWRAAETDSATIEEAEADARQAADSSEYTSPDALASALGTMLAADRNYVVRLGALTLTEQDGDILVIEGKPSHLRQLHEAIAAHAEQAGWSYIDVVED